MRASIWPIAVISIMIVALFGASISTMQTVSAAPATHIVKTGCKFMWDSGTASITLENDNLMKMICQFDDHQMSNGHIQEFASMPCSIMGVWTTDSHFIVTPSGHATLTCTIIK